MIASDRMFVLVIGGEFGDIELSVVQDQKSQSQSFRAWACTLVPLAFVKQIPILVDTGMFQVSVLGLVLAS